MVSVGSDGPDELGPMWSLITPSLSTTKEEDGDVAVGLAGPDVLADTEAVHSGHADVQ